MIDLQSAIVYDIETLPNCFTLNAQGLHSDLNVTFEISHFRDDRQLLFAWFNYWHTNQVPMIGFNIIAFDYPVIHFIWMNPDCTVEEIFDKAQEVIRDRTPFSTVWQDDRFAPQVDLFKIHHFDNKAKSTSLKALQVNMRSEIVLEMPLPWDQAIAHSDVDKVLIPYNGHDTGETKRFAHFSMDAIKFRAGLMETLRGDVMNFNDTKIGAKILEQRLGDELCYSWETGRKQPRQTYRSAIPLNDIIFPYIQFRNPEFNRILLWMRTQTLTADELTESIKTKGVFTGVTAHVGGIEFCFGTGGIHGSVASQRFEADEHTEIVDIDVAALYPSIAIVNRLYPEHLGETFVFEYAELPKERSKHKKGTVENAAFKLASNGTYGNSNNQFSVFYDPRFTMAITINGQLLLCMLAEWLLTVQTLQIIQINTDGITYRVNRAFAQHAKIIRGAWERLTNLVLEEAQYKRMWIRDVNNYIAEKTSGELKAKGAYWYPVKWPEDISNSSPPAWHKDFSNIVSIKAAVEHMVRGVDIERFIYSQADPFEFMCRAKVDRSSKLIIGDEEVQRITRFYVAQNGGQMRKVSPPVKGARVGDYKRKNGISDYEFHTIMSQLPPGTWDERIHTKNKSKYEIREMSIMSGFKVADCNVASRFDFANVNYEYYIDQARKLVIA